MASLQLTDVTKRFDALEALKSASFEVGDGQFVTLLGPSGAGKTTALKLIAGLESPDAGEIRIGGKLVNGLTAERRNTALVFENYALYPNMTVFENLAFPLRAPARAEKRSAEEISRRVLDVARILGIDGFMERRTWQLSGGQRQRVALGRALVRQPDVFLMDEPIAHLDAKLRFEMRAELKRLQRDIGITTLYATPDYGEAMALADVVVVLREGRVVQVGSPLSLFRQPANTYVAHLMGEPHINLFEVVMQSRNDELSVEGQGVRFELVAPQAKALQLRNLTRFTLGVRPSDVLVSPGPSSESSVPAEVLAVEPRGAATVIVLKVGRGQVVAKAAGEWRLRPDTNVWITVRPESLYFFEPETGARLNVPRNWAGAREVST